MSFLSLSETILRMMRDVTDHKERSDEGNTSAAVSDGHTVSTAGSDDHDRRERGDGLPSDDDGSDTQEHGSDEEVLWKGADWAKEASDSGTETSSDVLSPMSGRSEPIVEDMMRSQQDSESPEVASEAASNEAETALSAAVLRWDADRGAWVPAEILITAPPPLRPFAAAFPGIDGEVRASACRHERLDINTSTRREAVSVSNALDVDAAISSTSSVDFFALVSEEYYKASASPWTAWALNGTAMPFTPMATWGARPDPNAQVFVPSGEGLLGQLHPQRTRLSSRAASFVPQF